jgi:hypothetical protein
VVEVAGAGAFEPDEDDGGAAGALGLDDDDEDDGGAGAFELDELVSAQPTTSPIPIAAGITTARKPKFTILSLLKSC